MHIFLTGEIQVGKTTIIRNFLSQSNLAADGFITYWEPQTDANRTLYISSYSTDVQSVKRHLVTCCVEHKLSRTQNMVEAFDIHGTEILRNSGKLDIIVMDELGFMESKAKIFQNAVMQHISGVIPILGVIKPIKNTFLDAIRSHSNVKVCEVTEDNRDAVLAWLLKQSWK
jgi:nucleoside-triphosphatase